MNTNLTNNLNIKLVNDLLNTNTKYSDLRRYRLGDEFEKSTQNFRGFLKYLLTYELIERIFCFMGAGNNWQIDKAFEDIDLIPEEFLDDIGDCICKVIDANPDQYGELENDGLYHLTEDECIDFLLQIELIVAKEFGDKFAELAEKVKAVELPNEVEELQLNSYEEHTEKGSVEKHYYLMRGNKIVDLRNVSYYMNISTPPTLLKVAEESDMFNCLMSIICLAKYGKLKRIVCDADAKELAETYGFGLYVEIK